MTRPDGKADRPLLLDPCAGCGRPGDIAGDEGINASWRLDSPDHIPQLEWDLCASCSDVAETVSDDRLDLVLETLAAAARDNPSPSGTYNTPRRTTPVKRNV